MTYRISPKAGFVTMTSVAALMALGLSGTSAQAACVKVGTLVTCNAASPAYIDGGAGITVEVKALATVTAGAGSAVGLTGGGGAVTNSGVIDGAPGTHGVLLDKGGLIQNFKGGVVSGGMAAAIVVQNGRGVIENSGVINNATSAAIRIGLGSNNSQVTNRSGAQITAATFGIVLDQVNNSSIDNITGATIKAATGINVISNMGQQTLITNLGDLEGTTRAILGGDGNETIDNMNVITGGLSLGNGTNIVNNKTGVSSGVITGDIVGGSGFDNVTNGGRISGNLNLGSGDNYVGNLRTGLMVGNITTLGGDDGVINDGTVGTAMSPVVIDLGDGRNTLGNGKNGVIDGRVTMGVGNDTVTNSGTITGSIALGNGGNELTNNTDATISGSITAGIGNDRVINSGSIVGNIDLGAGDDLLGLNMRMSVVGTIGGGNGDDSLFLDGGMAGQSQTLSNNITNFETLSKFGAGKWVLGRDYDFATSTVINGGVLEIGTGFTLTSASVGVSGSGLLTGGGKVAGNVTVTGSGVLRPGDGTTGTLSVTGNVTVNAGSFVEVSVGPGALQSQLVVGGNVNLDGTLRISIAPGFYKSGASYDVITAGGVVNGQFGSVSLPAGMRFTKFKVNYAPKAVQVQVEKINYATIGNTYNQRQAGDGLFRGMAGSAAGDMERVAQAFEALTTDDAYRAALDSLSGDVYPVMQAVQERMAKNFRDVAGNRAQLFLEGTEVWGDILSTNQTIRSDGNGDQSKGDMRGAMVGIEQGFGYAKIGVFGGYGQGGTNLSQHLSSSKNNQIGGGAYAGVNYHGLVVLGQFSYAQGHNEVERHIAVGPSVQRNVNSKEKVRMLGGNASIGYEINLGGVSITPAVGVDFTSIHSDGFEEKGNGGDVGLEAKRRRDLVVSGEAGLRISASWNLGVINIAPYVSGKLSWQVVGNSYRDRDLAFQGNPNETGFNVRSADVGKNRLVVGGGLAIGVGMVKLELGYSQDVNVGGSKEESRNFTAGLGFRW